MAFLLPKSVFIHVPKTGGQWVIAALENSGVPVRLLGVVHSSADELVVEPEGAGRAFSFAFVRHPLSWYQSMWAHQTDDAWESIDAAEWFTPRWLGFWAEFTAHCASFDFNEFVRKCVNHYPGGLVSTLYRSYTEGCTFVGRQERLADDLVQALECAGESFDPLKLLATPTRNVRGARAHRSAQNVYTRELVDLVMETESWAVGHFDYRAVPARILQSLRR